MALKYIMSQSCAHIYLQPCFVLAHHQLLSLLFSEDGTGDILWRFAILTAILCTAIFWQPQPEHLLIEFKGNHNLAASLSTLSDHSLSFTGENEGHPFPVQGHRIRGREEAEDHLHQISTSAIIVSENHWLVCFQMSHPVHIGPMLFQKCPDSAESNTASRVLEITKIVILKWAVYFVQRIAILWHRCQWKHSHH